MHFLSSLDGEAEDEFRGANKLTLGDQPIASTTSDVTVANSIILFAKWVQVHEACDNTVDAHLCWAPILSHSLHAAFS